MKLSEAGIVRAMIASHDEFSAIEITINSDRETYSPSQAKQIPTGEVLVTLRIPHEGIDILDFHRQLWETLNSERGGAIQREQGR